MTTSGRQAFLKTLNHGLSLLLIGSLFIFSSCDDDEVALAISEDTQVAESNPSPDEGNQDESGEEAPPIQADFTQDFEDFNLQGSWFLSDFGINTESERSDYVSESKIKFGLSWTKRARNLMADRLEIERSLMTNEYTNTICEPKLEIGKESVYTGNTSDNLIAELDSDLSHCGISGQDPATLKLHSFIPTKIGYKYKLNVSYKMRSYGSQVVKSYKDLVVRFGSELEKFDPSYEDFSTVAIEMTSTSKFSKIIISDNGLPDSYGVLVDNIEVREIGKTVNYDSCAEIFQINSKGFKKCVTNEVNTEEVCDFESVEDTFINYKEGTGVDENRKNISNALLVEPATSGVINFLSLGIRGSISMGCKVGGHPALFDIHGKTLKMQEVSWGNVTSSSYPELAKVRVKLEGCDQEELNRVNTVGTIQTKESFSLTFNDNEDGLSYSGCKMSRLIIKDITPTGPSTDGIDLNSIRFTND